MIYMPMTALSRTLHGHSPEGFILRSFTSCCFLVGAGCRGENFSTYAFFRGALNKRFVRARSLASTGLRPGPLLTASAFSRNTFDLSWPRCKAGTVKMEMHLHAENLPEAVTF